MSYLFILRMNFDLFFGNACFYLVKLGIQSADLHRVLRLKLLQFRADVGHFFLPVGKTVFEAVEERHLFAKFYLFGRQEVHNSRSTSSSVARARRSDRQRSGLR